MRQRRTPLHLLLTLLLALSWGAAAQLTLACSASDSLEASGASPDDNSNPDDDLVDVGIQTLRQHDLRGARDAFAFAAEQTASPRHPEALVGLTLTSLALAPESGPAADAIARLGGRPLDMQRAIFGNGALLSMLADHVDELAIEEHLDQTMPWTADQLERPELIMDLVPEGTTGNHVTDDLARLAGELTAFADNLDAAANDPRFSAFTLPGDAFFARTTLRLTRPELLLIQASLRASASLLLWLSAYSWEIDLKRELGTESTLEARVAAFNRVAFRTLREDASSRLAASTDQLRRATQNLKAALQSGLTNTVQGNLDWTALSSDEVNALAALLDAVNAATTDRTPLPATEPPTDLDLRPLLEGRTLPAEHNILTYEVDEFGDARWDFDWAGVRVLWFEGIIDPSCDPDPDVEDSDCPELSIGDDPVQRVSDPFLDSIEADYNIQ